MPSINQLLAELTSVDAISGYAAALAGALTMHLFLRYVNRRVTIRWSVQTILLPIEALDGKLELKYEGRSQKHVYWQQLEIQNTSGSKDLRDVAVSVVAPAPAIFIGHKLPTDGQFYYWTADFQAAFDRLVTAINENRDPLPEDRLRLHTNRDFVIPTLNRGDTLRFTFANTTLDNSIASFPEVTVHCVHPGTRMVRSERRATFWGVDQIHASVTGLVVGLILVIALGSIVSGVALGIAAYALGAFTLALGAAAILAGRAIRRAIG